MKESFMTTLLNNSTEHFKCVHIFIFIFILLFTISGCSKDKFKSLFKKNNSGSSAGQLENKTSTLSDTTTDSSVSSEETSSDLVFSIPQEAYCPEPASSEQVAGLFPEVGGSVYANYSAGNYNVDPVADQGKTLKSVILDFHRNPSLVKYQLETMYKNGQRGIALILYFVYSGHAPNQPEDRWYHSVVPVNGKLSTLHESNLRQILKIIKDVGYTTLIFRFGGQGGAYPGAADGGWRNTWYEDRYQEAWNLLVNTRDVIESELSNSQVKRWYDLHAELACPANADCGQNREYMRRMWLDYRKAFGSTPTDTYGFSIVPNDTVFSEMMNIYDNAKDENDVSARPPMYAFDVYGKGFDKDATPNIYTEYEFLDYIQDEIHAAEESDKPIIIQESFYNDYVAMLNFWNARNVLNLNIRAIYQWPTYRKEEKKNYYEEFSPEYSAYLSGGQLSLPCKCILEPGVAACKTLISWQTNYDSACILARKGNETSVPVTTSKNGDNFEIPWITKDIFTFELRSSCDAGSLLLAKKAVTAVDPQLYAIPQTCILDASGICSSRIFWQSYSSNICVLVGDQTFSCGMKEYSYEAPWIPEGDTTFELKEGSTTSSNTLSTTVVHGQR